MMILVNTQLISFLLNAMFITTLAPAARGNNFCPASSLFDTVTDGRLGYPQWFGRQDEHGPSFNCETYGLNYEREESRCFSNSSRCPVSAQEIEAALAPQSWKSAKYAFCRIHHAIMSKTSSHKVKIIITGGSMTVGRYTNSQCCCFQSSDLQCPKRPAGAVHSCSDRQCSWVFYFKNWLLKSFSSVEFSVIDISRSGEDSNAMMENIINNLREKNIQLTKSDIVIMDHSVNDVVNKINIADLSGRQVTRSESVELLIKKLLLYANDERPSLVLIEPYAQETDKDFKYTRTYRELAKHYNISLWSVRSSYMTFFNNSIDMAARYPINPLESQEHIVTHPSWVVHLFMGDIISNCFAHFVRSCSADHYAQSSSIDFENLQLPSPKYISTSNGICDSRKATLLYRAANSTFSPGDLLAFETDLEARSSGWRDYIDYHEVPGFIITKHSNLSKASLKFLFDPPPTGVSYESHLIKLSFLKSYADMVSFCRTNKYQKLPI